MFRHSLSRFLTILAFACCAAAASAQQMSNPYGPPVTLEAAKKIAVPALAEARKNGWTMAVAIVDPAGEYYDDYYAVFFLDPDGMTLEGMRYGERHAKAARTLAARKKAAAPKQPSKKRG